MAPILELKGVTFFSQGRRIVRNFSHVFEEGKTTALAGPSGGGKTTVLKLAAGLIVPSAGEVDFRGENLYQMGRKKNLAFRREGAVVFQDSALWANQTILQILELPLRIHYPDMSRGQREKRVEETVVSVGFNKDLSIRPDRLSAGEKKLVAFARALLCHPKLLFLDEWTESLDDNSAQRLIDIVKKLQAEGNTIIFVSHNMQIMQDLPDYILMIFGGQLFLRLTREQVESDEDLMRYIRKGMTA
jgi:ABC-type multidrug transport system ATPase subunit